MINLDLWIYIMFMLANIFLIGARLFAFIARFIEPQQRDTVVFLTPGAEGSLGDEAMLGVALADLRERFDGPIVFLSVRRTKFHNGMVPGFGVRHVSIEELIKFPYPLIKLMACTHTFRFIGADVVAGFYSTLAAVLRVALTQAFALAGADSAIISFSFSANPQPAMIRMLKRISPKIDLMVRDPESHRRLTKILPRPPGTSADLAFLLKENSMGLSSTLVDWIEGSRQSGQLIIGFTLNAMIVSRAGAGAFDQLDIMIRQLMISDPARSLLFVSHDSRDPDSDLEVVRTLFKRMADDFGSRLYLVDDPLSAQQAKALAGKLDAIVSGRLHFAIAGLGNGIPAFGFSYQGKFEGLFELLGLKDEFHKLTVNANTMFDDPHAVAEKVELFLERRKIFAEKIKQNLPPIKQLAHRNLVYKAKTLQTLHPIG